MSIVIIDNYDSFTYNLFQLVSSVATTDVRVIQNDDYLTWHSIDFLASLDALIISPGPGRPEFESDFGISRLALGYDVPLLGVCLGHQGLCYWDGGAVTTAPEPWHGRISSIAHDGSGIFAGIPSPFLATRYHSLMVGDVPDSFRITACTTDRSGKKLVMGVEHRTRAQWGVQFHPESIATQYGRELVDNFLQLARCRSRRRISVKASGARAHAECLALPADGPTPTGRFQLISRRLLRRPDCEQLYSQLFANQEGAFWLDSSRVIEGLSRFSILGGCGPLGEWVTAEANSGVTVRAGNGAITHLEQSIFDYLKQQTAERAVTALDNECDFALGYVGYLGYEMKSECGGDAVHQSDLPDAGFVFCDRAVVVDHNLGQTWLLALACEDGGDEAQAVSWLDGAERAVRESLNGRCVESEHSSARAFVPVIEREPPTKYASNIRQCMKEIRAGETYEVCLTTTLTVDATIDTLETYRDLRRRNPVPYGALLQFPAVDVLCASPERFVKISADRVVEAKPIKGTRRRGCTPDEDAMLAYELRTAEKDRAENLMILDLLRNDLGQVAKVNSVHVPRMFAVETYATVHQLVSTIRARLRDDVSPAECVRAVFPGGSMTGAPKRRTMQIIDRLEGGPRGIYSGAIGYFSLSGAVDLNIVIRTMVVHDGRITIGTGGAIVALSDAEEELAEIQLKAHALVESIRATARTIASHPEAGDAEKEAQEKRRVDA
ncbi:aminodeoxychorismate synthase component I [Mycobacterium sp. 852002-51057_SCH5723018]|uniref:aminodeoxychorismate synthase component I n=1 Tax=Mycobacterium sp. 852002-51057_SCH5723018 TaxID=1834094 RepID=UPI000802280B|nr:aminodeoxychorismate synthase component I [Mycobacterium sp. 852002-51057_SCH5723018]OBG29371.1 aminodeoxychorismate synthase, component I [Mycobacterium sp. 852002-51057_SCH5723018]